jgi:hypothetical protein
MKGSRIMADPTKKPSRASLHIPPQVAPVDRAGPRGALTERSGVEADIVAPPLWTGWPNKYPWNGLDNMIVY